jgi:hypothetical protein
LLKNNHKGTTVILERLPKISAMKKSEVKNAGKKESANNEQLKTEPPISEKDEMKEAERRTNKAAKKR